MDWRGNIDGAWRRTRRLCVELTSRDDGNVAILFALLFPVVVGGVGLGVDTSYWYHEHLRLQAMADAAAYAGGQERLAGSAKTRVVVAVTFSAGLNGFDDNTDSITVNVPPTSGSYAGMDAVEVIITRPVPRLFSAIFSQEPVPESARAVATLSVASKACILALSQTAARAALFSGNTTVKLSGCTVASNSNSNEAIRLQGSAQLSVDCLVATGGVTLGSGATLTQCNRPITNSPRSPDPFADLPVPTPSGPCLSVPNNATTLGPGRYCQGMSLRGDVTLQPGVYYVEANNFSVNANANISGTGVTIYLTNSAGVSMNGNATVNLSAPTSGTYAGVLFFADPNSTGSDKYNGTASSSLTGAIYAAGRDVEYNGNFSGTNGCVQVVASTVSWSGNSTINQDCTGLGMRDLRTAQAVSLVE